MPRHVLEPPEVVSCDVVDRNDLVHEAEGPIRLQSPKAIDNDEPLYVFCQIGLPVAIE